MSPFTKFHVNGVKYYTLKTTLPFFLAVFATLLFHANNVQSQFQAYHFQPVTSISSQHAGEMITRINEFVDSYVICRFSTSTNELVVLSQEELDVAAILNYLEDSGDYVADMDNRSFATEEAMGPEYYSLESVKKRWYQAHRFKLNLGIQSSVMLLTQQESLKIPAERLKLLLSENKAIVID